MSFSSVDDDEPMSDINVTPFVDVLLVLLIIFMITAPIVNYVVQVDLPQDSYNQDGAPLDKPLRVVISDQGVIYVNDQEIGPDLNGSRLQQFTALVRSHTSQQPEPMVDLEADRAVDYGKVVPVIARIKEMQVGLNLVITPLGG